MRLEITDMIDEIVLSTTDLLNSKEVVSLNDDDLNEIVASGCKDYATRFCRNYGKTQLR